MKTRELLFSMPGQIRLQEVELRPPTSKEVVVETRFSAISSGTEMLVFQGNLPEDLEIDSTLECFSGDTFSYPCRYGYSCVGRVVAVGDDNAKSLLGKRAFAFHPHASHFCITADQLLILEDDISSKDALFLPFMETAVNFVMDGRPLIGEKMVVIGQGVVGLLTTAALALFPHGGLVTVEPLENRQKISVKYGADRAIAPGESLLELNADLVFELSGSPEGLNAAIKCCGFHSRIVVGSWYGNKRSSLDLGTSFHRNRIQLLSSQVSTIDSQFQARWSKKRRLQQALNLIRILKPSRLVSHTFPFDQAQRAYETIATDPDRSLQVILRHSQS